MITKKLFNVISTVILSVTMVVVLLVVNFSKETLKVNDVCEELTITLKDGNSFDVIADEKSTLLYFFESLTKEDETLLREYENEGLNIILISSSEIDYQGNNVLIADKSAVECIDMFSDDGNFPYSVFLDQKNTIKLKKNILISENDYLSIVLPTVLGKTVGYNVGDICINIDVGIIGQNDEVIDTFSLINERGKITVINFWADWCTPCVMELPHFNSVYEANKNDVTMVAIHHGLSTKYSTVYEFIAEKFYDFGIIFGYDANAELVFSLGGTDALPYTIIIDQNGIVSFRKIGPMSEEELSSEINKLIE